MTPVPIGHRKLSFDKSELRQDKSADQVKDKWKKLDISKAKESSIVKNPPVIQDQKSMRSITRQRHDYSNVKEVLISNFETQYMPNGFYMFSKLSKNGCLTTEMSTIGMIPKLTRDPTNHTPRTIS